MTDNGGRAGIRCHSHANAPADDTVYLVTPSNPQLRAKVSGDIKEYNGRELVLDIGGADNAIRPSR